MTDYHDAYLAKARFGALDGLRFVAIAAVLFHHSPTRDFLVEQNHLFSRGFLGVDLFFVISGFLITSLLVREQDRTGEISLKGFYWRRALRILPLYLLVVTAVGFYFVVVKKEPGAAELWPFYYLFLANFLVGDIPTLSPMWSLSVEEQYYLIWPLILVLLPRKALLPLLAVIIAANVLGVMGVFGIMPPEIGPLRFALPNATYAPILIGSALAYLLHTKSGFRIAMPVLLPWGAAPVWAILLTVLLVILPEDLIGLPNLLLHIAMAGLVGSLVIREDSPLSAALGAAPIVRIGLISYGIYLLHLVALDIAMRSVGLMGLSVTGLTLNVIYIGLSLALAELSFRTFEKFFLDLRHKPLGRVRTDRRPKRAKTD